MADGTRQMNIDHQRFIKLSSSLLSGFPSERLPSLSARLSVRLAEERDIGQLAEFVNSAYRGESGMKGWTSEAAFIGGQRLDSEMVRSLMTDEASVVLLLETVTLSGSTLVGCVHVSQFQKNSVERIGHFGLLTVGVEFQNKGFGDMLLVLAEAFVKSEMGLERMRLLVITIRDTLIEWYFRRGYRDTGERIKFPYGQAQFGQPLVDDLRFMVMEKNLS
jgi:ribosomal protein S18 acetylase RimI-like enzyme